MGNIWNKYTLNFDAPFFLTLKRLTGTGCLSRSRPRPSASPLLALPMSPRRPLLGLQICSSCHGDERFHEVVDWNLRLCQPWRANQEETWVVEEGRWGAGEELGRLQRTCHGCPRADPTAHRRNKEKKHAERRLPEVTLTHRDMAMTAGRKAIPSVLLLLVRPPVALAQLPAARRSSRSGSSRSRGAAAAEQCRRPSPWRG